MRARVAWVAALVAAALLATVAPASASVAAAKNGCKLLKRFEVANVLDAKIAKAAKPTAPPETRVCGYTVVGALGRSVNLWVDEGSAATAGFSTAKQVFGKDVEKVSGFGKKAFYVGGGLNTLYVLKGDSLVYVQYVALDLDDQDVFKDAVSQMMKIVLQRI